MMRDDKPRDESVKANVHLKKWFHAGAFRDTGPTRVFGDDPPAHAPLFNDIQDIEQS